MLCSWVGGNLLHCCGMFSSTSGLSLVAQTVKASAYNVGDLGSIPGWEDLLEKEIAAHSSILAWKIP